MPQRAPGGPGYGAGLVRSSEHTRCRSRPAGLGAGRAQAAARHDAAGRPPTPRPSDARRVCGVARSRARSRSGRQPEPRPAGDPPADHRRVHQRHPEPAGSRDRRALAAVSGRRRGPGGLRDQRRCAVGLAGPVRPLSLRREPCQPSCRRRPHHRAGVRRSHLRHAPTAVSGRPDERGAPVRVAGGHGDSPLLSTRRRLRGEGPVAPDDLRLHRRHGHGTADRGATRWHARRALHGRRRGPRRLSVRL